MGSGAGFPGLVLALVCEQLEQTILVEANQKKSQFLREVIRLTGARAEVRTERIENLGPIAADVITARALSPLEKLLEFQHLHGSRGELGLYHKGRSVNEELTAAQQSWTFDSETVPSAMGSGSVIVKVRNLVPLN